jgi:formyl-CoA transferase
LQPTRIEDGSIVPLPGPVAKFSRTPTRVRTGAPALGQHSDEVLAETGIDASSRGRLKESGVI